MLRHAAVVASVCGAARGAQYVATGGEVSEGSDVSIGEMAGAQYARIYDLPGAWGRTLIVTSRADGAHFLKFDGGVLKQIGGFSPQTGDLAIAADHTFTLPSGGAKKIAMEGQAVEGNVLVVLAVCRGSDELMHPFSSPPCFRVDGAGTKDGYAPVMFVWDLTVAQPGADVPPQYAVPIYGWHAALHVQFAEQNGALFAVMSSGFNAGKGAFVGLNHHSEQARAIKVATKGQNSQWNIDLTQTSQPEQITLSVELPGITYPESCLIYKAGGTSYMLTGGVQSKELAQINLGDDVSGLASGRTPTAVDVPGIGGNAMKQMVGRALYSGGAHYAVLANFGEPGGGIDVFRLAGDGGVQLAGGVIDASGPVANRVVLKERSGRSYAFVPLEKEQDFLVYDVSTPFAPQRIKDAKSRALLPPDQARTYSLEVVDGDIAGALQNKCSAAGTDCFTVFLFTEKGGAHRFSVAIDWTRLPQNAEWHAATPAEGVVASRHLNSHCMLGCVEEQRQCFHFGCPSAECLYTGAEVHIDSVTSTAWVGSKTTKMTAAFSCDGTKPSDDGFMTGHNALTSTSVDNGGHFHAIALKQPLRCGTEGLQVCVQNIDVADGADIHGASAKAWVRCTAGCAAVSERRDAQPRRSHPPAALPLPPLALAACGAAGAAFFAWRWRSPPAENVAAAKAPYEYGAV